MIDTPIGNNKCPHCGYLMDTATGAYEDAVPVPHDLTLCLNCGGMIEFADDMEMVVLDSEVFNRLPEDTKRKLKHAQKTIRLMPHYLTLGKKHEQKTD